MTSSEPTTSESLIYLRGWHNAEGMAVVRAEWPTPIEVVPSGFSAVERCRGFFHTFGGRVRSAVFALDERLFFQLEQERWDWLRDGVRVECRRRFSGATTKDCVSVFAGGQRRLETTYSPSVADMIRAGDMTIDFIDETSDWWRWLSYVVGNAKSREQLLTRWREGASKPVG